jgi:hypothetical protein
MQVAMEEHQDVADTDIWPELYACGVSLSCILPRSIALDLAFPLSTKHSNVDHGMPDCFISLYL